MGYTCSLLAESMPRLSLLIFEIRQFEKNFIAEAMAKLQIKFIMHPKILQNSLNLSSGAKAV